MDTTAVTNARFQEFVTDTDFVTEADRIGGSLVFQGLLPEGSPPSRAIAQTPWWRVIAGENWRNPVGFESAALLGIDHPVTHVSWNDATAFVHWAGGRLPTEAVREHAARGGLEDAPFPWGDAEPNDSDFCPCNIWQGQFPRQNTVRDGYFGAAPAQSFARNGYGLYNIVGNVWEMTSEVFKVRSLKKEVVAAHAGKRGYKLSKGGLLLCHRSCRYRYRISSPLDRFLCNRLSGMDRQEPLLATGRDPNNHKGAKLVILSAKATVDPVHWQSPRRSPDMNDWLVIERSVFPAIVFRGPIAPSRQHALHAPDR
jgi:sulfatase modifying factor 1